MSDAYQASPEAADRLAEVLALAGFPSGTVVLNAFGPAYPALDAQADAAIWVHGCTPIAPDALLAAEDPTATCFVGPPDRLFALMQSGYGQVLDHAVLAGGAVFPVVRDMAADQGITLVDVMHHDSVGPFAARTDGTDRYQVLGGVTVTIVRPGGDDPLSDGMVGEVCLLDQSGDRIRTGILSAKDPVQGTVRLKGWMGPATEAVAVEDGRAVSASTLATLVARYEDVLDARFLASDPGKSEDEAPVLQVETEAGSWIDDELRQHFAEETGVEPRIERVAPGQLPNTGRVLVGAAA